MTSLDTQEIRDIGKHGARSACEAMYRATALAETDADRFIIALHVISGAIGAMTAYATAFNPAFNGLDEIEIAIEVLREVKAARDSKP